MYRVTFLHFFAKLVLLMQRIVPYLFLQNYYNQRESEKFAIPPLPTVEIFCEGKHGKSFRKFDSSHFCFICILYGPVGKEKGLRSHGWGVRTTVQAIYFTLGNSVENFTGNYTKNLPILKN